MKPSTRARDQATALIKAARKHGSLARKAEVLGTVKAVLR